MPKSKKPDSSGPSSTTSTPRSVGTPRSDGTNRGKRTHTTDSGDIAALDKLLADLEFEDPEPPIPLRRPPGTKPEPETPARLRSGSDLSPATLPSAHIIEPSTIDGTHTATLVCLHGFTSSGHEYAEEIVPQLKARLALEQFSGLRFVFLNAPKRRITCYGRSKSNAWHDYFTDHGGEGGCPEIEEEIDLAHLEWTRRQVHNAFDAEAARLDGDATRVLVVGQSQGACCALDAVLTYKRLLGGAFCSIGQLYSHTPVPSSKGSMHIATFNGASDACIAPGLALRSYARLLDAGYANVAMHMQPLLDHQGSTSEEVSHLIHTLRTLELLSPASAHPPAVGATAGGDAETPVATTRASSRANTRGSTGGRTSGGVSGGTRGSTRGSATGDADGDNGGEGSTKRGRKNRTATPASGEKPPAAASGEKPPAAAKPPVENSGGKPPKSGRSDETSRAAPKAHAPAPAPPQPDGHTSSSQPAGSAYASPSQVVIGSHHLDANRGSKGLTAASKYDAYGEAHGPNTSSS